MRLQFWHDAIEKMYANNIGYIPDHPVIKQLNIVIIIIIYRNGL